jgi:hypothetical protein
LSSLNFQVYDASCFLQNPDQATRSTKCTRKHRHRKIGFVAIAPREGAFRNRGGRRSDQGGGGSAGVAYELGHSVGVGQGFTDARKNQEARLVTMDRMVMEF